MKKKKAFTLIELIAVLVILAIIALIVTPLVMSIIKKSKVSADMRSIDAYGRSVEIGVASYLLDHQDFPTSFEDITVEYRGSTVVCSDVAVNMDGSIYLNKCAVNGTIVKDPKSSTGYYQFGKDTGSYMFYHLENVSDNSSQQSGNSGSSQGSNQGSSQGSNQAVTPGSLITYGGVSFYAIPSNVSGYTVLMKTQPLTYDEIVALNTGVKVTNTNGYGAIPYYTGDNCNNTDSSGCKTDYASSNVKIVIDAWALNHSSNLKPGEEYSIMTIEQLVNGGYILNNGNYVITDRVDSSFYELGVSYWALDTNGNVVYSGSRTFRNVPVYDVAAVRPIIVVKTSSIRPNNSNSNNSGINNVNNNTNNKANPYTVDNIIIYVALLVIVVCVTVLIIYLLNKNKNKDEKNNKEDKK